MIVSPTCRSWSWSLRSVLNSRLVVGSGREPRKFIFSNSEPGKSRKWNTCDVSLSGTRRHPKTILHLILVLASTSLCAPQLVDYFIPPVYWAEPCKSPAACSSLWMQSGQREFGVADGHLRTVPLRCPHLAACCTRGAEQCLALALTCWQNSQVFLQLLTYQWPQRKPTTAENKGTTKLITLYSPLFDWKWIQL